MNRSNQILVTVVALLAILALMVARAPVPVEADINSITWLGAVYEGEDSLLGTYVRAFETGSTATLKVVITNTTEDAVVIKGVRLKMDWPGGEYAANAADYPATLSKYETGVVMISFVVPAESVASNLIPHSYVVSVDCDREGGYTVGGPITGQVLAIGDGENTNFILHAPVDPSTLTIYLNGVATTDYELLDGNYVVKFNTPPPAGSSITMDYESKVKVASGSGTGTEFYLGHAPIVAGSEKIYVSNTLSASHTVDYDTGWVKFSSPPKYGAEISASFQYYDRWTYERGDFAVYSSEQAASVRDRDSGILDAFEPTRTLLIGVGLGVGIVLVVLGGFLIVLRRLKRPSMV